jgi:hypothetical protein
MTAGDTARRALAIETLATTARLHAALADGPAVEAIARAGDTCTGARGGRTGAGVRQWRQRRRAQHFVAELVGRFERTAGLSGRGARPTRVS